MASAVVSTILTIEDKFDGHRALKLEAGFPWRFPLDHQVESANRH
jgi:hypothetical protein